MSVISTLAVPAAGVLVVIALVAIGPPGSHNGPALDPSQRSVLNLPGAPATPELAVSPPAPAAVSASGVTLKAVAVTLPTSDRVFPAGPHVDAITNNCLACHSAGMVLNQPSLTRSEWEGEVGKMRKTYKAPVSDADATAIVDYLASTKGL